VADAQDSYSTTTGRRGLEPSTCQPVGQQTPVSFSACCAAAIQTASCQTGDNTACKHVTKKELCKRCFSKYRAVEGTEQIILSCMSPFFHPLAKYTRSYYGLTTTASASLCGDKLLKRGCMTLHHFCCLRRKGQCVGQFNSFSNVQPGCPLACPTASLTYNVV
jgi:hypothetical protein